MKPKVVRSEPIEPPRERQRPTEPAQRPFDSIEDSAAGFIEDSEPSTNPAQLFRRADDRARPNVNDLKKFGIRRHASKRFVLFTDIEDQQLAAELPRFCDALYDELVSYFGELPPAPDNSDFQVTGYIMRNRSAFERSELLTEAIPEFAHGRHVGYEFWMNEQQRAYYRRHLMLHEFTHCFMTCTVAANDLPSVWYMEGMAEYFATHRIAGDGAIQFRVMPSDLNTFGGRIAVIQQSLGRGTNLSFDELFSFDGNSTVDTRHYAFSWATCYWLDTHPRWQRAFRELTRNKSTDSFLTALSSGLLRQQSELRSEWNVFVRELDAGFDSEAMQVHACQEAAGSRVDEFRVIPSKNWQCAGISLAGTRQYTFTATNRVTLDTVPREWETTADGITVRYANGFPVGTLLGRIRNPKTLFTSAPPSASAGNLRIHSNAAATSMCG